MKTLSIYTIVSILLMTFSTNKLFSQVRIQMTNENGIFTTPCKVNGLELKFIFDTGASNVSVSLSEALFMLKNGYIDEDDIKGASYSQIANGDLVENTQIILKELEIAGIKLFNIDATIIHEIEAPLLLGQSAIQKLGRIQIEGDELVLLDWNQNLIKKVTNEEFFEALDLIKEATNYFFDELPTLSVETFNKAYKISLLAFSCDDLYIYSLANYQIENFDHSIDLSEKSLTCASDSFDLYCSYELLGSNYEKIGNIYKAVLNYEKALVYVNDENFRSLLFASLAGINFDQKKYIKAIDYYEKAAQNYGKYKSISKYDIINHRVSDDYLGEIFYNMYLIYNLLDDFKTAEKYLIHSARCGYSQAINVCEEYNIYY